MVSAVFCPGGDVAGLLCRSISGVGSMLCGWDVKYDYILSEKYIRPLLAGYVPCPWPGSRSSPDVSAWHMSHVCAPGVDCPCCSTALCRPEECVFLGRIGPERFTRSDLAMMYAMGVPGAPDRCDHGVDCKCRACLQFDLLNYPFHLRRSC